MRHNVVKAVGLTFMVTLLLAIALAGSFMWRLSQGPVALTFLRSTVQSTINSSLAGMQVKIGDVIIERDQDTGSPRIRLRDIRLMDPDGNMIARAPRAAIEVSAAALLTGKVVPEQLDLIGPRIMARRMLNGTLQLGFGVTGLDQKVSQTGAKGDRAIAAPDVTAAQEQPGTNLIDYLRKEIAADQRGVSPVSSVMAVRITHASISIYDEANDALWFAPKANLVVRRMPYGFALFADASIASGKEPWRTEVVANYRIADHRFAVSARLFDLVPADLSNQVFALSQLAQVRLPLSGHAEVEFTDTGQLTKASAELTVSAGMVGFPGYISEPIIVDEGLLRFDYEPSTGDIVIGNSAIFVGGSQAQLDGRIEPQRDATGHLKSVRLSIKAHNVAIDAQGGIRNPFIFDNVTFTGVASVANARLDVENLTFQSGDALARIKGYFLGEDGGIGIYLAGAMRNVTAGMVKKLWPPVVAPGARAWIADNVIAGYIPDGTFQIGLPAKVIDAALHDATVPDNLVKAKFSLAGLKFRYFEDLPPIANGKGEALLTGNNFRIDGGGGSVTLASGHVLEVVKGDIAITDLAARQSPAVINVEAAGEAQDFLKLMDAEPLRLLSKQNIDISRLAGKVHAKLNVRAPLSIFLKPEQVSFEASARIDNGSFDKAVPGVALSDMNIDLAVDKDTIKANGSAKVNDIPAKLGYVRNLDGSGAEVQVDASLNADMRAKLGADLTDYLIGTTPVKVKAAVQGGKVMSAHVEADLSDATLKLDPIKWQRGALKGTRASFDLDLSNPDILGITNLTLTGGDLKIDGDVHLGADGSFRDAKFSSFRLDAANDLKVTLKDSKGLLVVDAAGDSFDARPLIGDLFSSSGRGQSQTTPPPVQVTANIGQVYANRGEVIANVSGSLQLVGGQVLRADLNGVQPDNAPIALKISPNQQGLRDLRIVARNGGAALRASNLYSKISGGSLEFDALLGAGTDGSIQQGRLTIRDFEVLGEQALKAIPRQMPGKQQKQAPAPTRGNGQFFSKLTLPFSSDANYVRIGDALIRGPELGASAQGIVRKADGAMDIGGTIIPAYALNAALGEVPVLGEILVGGKGQGLFGLNYALKGTMSKPEFLVNPVSAIAPGFLRNLFGIGGVSGINADGTPGSPAQTPPRGAVNK